MIHKDYFKFFTDLKEDENVILNLAVLRNKDSLINDLLELIRSGYGLTGVYREDIDLLYRLRMLEDVLEQRYFLYEHGLAQMTGRGFIFDYKNAPKELKDDLVWSYFLNFKHENPYYKKFSFLSSGAGMFIEDKAYDNGTYDKTLPSNNYIGMTTFSKGGVRNGRGRDDLDPNTMLLDDINVYLDLPISPTYGSPIVFMPKYLKIKGYEMISDRIRQPLYYKGPLKNLTITYRKSSPLDQFQFKSENKIKPYIKVIKDTSLPYFMYESLYNEGEFL